eukprot:3998089-Pyramimonas_sp.AAC.1
MDAAEIVHDTCPTYDRSEAYYVSHSRRSASSGSRASICWRPLAKVLPGGYARKVVISNLWTLRPDDRVPSMRGRKLPGPEKAATNKEVDDLIANLAEYVKQELYDDTDGNDEISTWPVE